MNIVSNRNLRLQILGKDKLESHWYCDRNFNIHVNFCIWVLLVDGLLVPPFISHLDGNRCLQKRGLNPRSWQYWLETVVATQDYRLSKYWQIEDLQSELEKQLSEWQVMIDLGIKNNPNIVSSKLDWVALRSSIEADLNWKYQQYQQAAKRAGNLSCNTTPPEAWNGNSSIREQLDKLWVEYQDLNYSYTPISDTREQIVKYLLAQEDPGLHLIEKFENRLEALLFHFIDYPVDIEYPISPISVLISISQEIPNYDEYLKRLFRGAEYLCTLIRTNNNSD